MPAPNENTANCEIRAVNRLFGFRDVKTAGIHRTISEVCGKNVMSDQMVWKCVTAFITVLLHDSAHAANRTQELIGSFVLENT